MDLDRFDWLSQRVEEPIDPDREIVDPHHHLWQRGGSTYLAPELLADITGTHNITKTVFVECLSKYDRDAEPDLMPVGETAFVAAEADAADKAGGPTVAGIVSHANMMLGDEVEEILVAHAEAAGGRFRGIRHSTAWDASDELGPGHSNPFENMMLTDEFRAGVARLAAMGYTFDAWLYHPQIPQLDQLAKAVPEATIILNHLGAPMGVGPYRENRTEVKADWQASMRQVAANSNVVLKVGGIGMDSYYGTGWTELDVPPGSEEVAAYWGDDVRWCIDLFGPDRCMFESNFPVDRQSLTYPVLWNAMQIMAAGYNDEEQGQMFSGTATRVYNLS